MKKQLTELGGLRLPFLEKKGLQAEGLQVENNESNASLPPFLRAPEEVDSATRAAILSQRLPSIQRVAYATLQGYGHKGDGAVCQDTACGKTVGALSVVSVADGLGSLSLSHLGSRASCEAACNLFSSEQDFNVLFNMDLMGLKHHIVAAVRDAIFSCANAYAKENSADPDFAAAEMRCTLILAAFLDDKYLLCRIGDGAAFFVEDGHINHLFSLDQAVDEGHTRTVLDGDAESSLEILRGDSIGKSLAGVILTTDGSRLYAYYPSSVVVPSEMYSLYKSVTRAMSASNDPCEALRAYLASIQANTIGDDLGFAVIVNNYTELDAPVYDFGWTCDCGYRHGYNDLVCPHCGKGFLQTYQLEDTADLIGSVVSVNQLLDYCDNHLVDYAVRHFEEAGYTNKLSAMVSIWQGFVGYANSLASDGITLDTSLNADPFFDHYFKELERDLVAFLETVGINGISKSELVMRKAALVDSVMKVHLARLRQGLQRIG